MAVGAKDRIDKLLVKKYAKEQVGNHDLTAHSMVNPEKMMEAMKLQNKMKIFLRMNDYASVHKNMMMMSNRISDLCACLKAKARYSPHLQAKASQVVNNI